MKVCCTGKCGACPHGRIHTKMVWCGTYDAKNCYCKPIRKDRKKKGAQK